jgi:hypothetical protein
LFYFDRYSKIKKDSNLVQELTELFKLDIELLTDPYIVEKDPNLTLDESFYKEVRK